MANAPRLSLLTSTGNPKTAKGRARGYAVAVLHLAPHTLAGGPNICPQASAGCIALCLNLAGRGGLAAGGIISHAELASGARTNSVQEARTRRTRLLYSDRALFASMLRHDLVRFAKWAKAEGFIPALRMNGTSDLDWDGMLPEVMAEAAALGFVRYDYTKVNKRIAKRSGPGYHLTLSLTEDNDAAARDVLARGGNVAAIFDTRKGRALPATYELDGETFRVIDGDADDLRFLDPAGVIVGLRAKGYAGRRDASGMVRKVADTGPGNPCQD